MQTQHEPRSGTMPARAIKEEAHIRWLVRVDMPEVLDIDELCYPNQRWTEEGFLTYLRQRNCIGMVAEHQERVVGCMIYELHKAALHVVYFAVHPFYQRSGVGTVIVDRLKHKIRQQRRTQIRLEVRDDNLAAQLFFRAMGFKARGVEREFFADGTDAYRMVYTLE